MHKIIFNKIAYDIVIFFIISSISLTLIAWVIQAVNFLDIVSEDGHSLKVYFIYTSLNIPKIFSKILIFVFFISIFYIINKYEDNNEMLVLWSNGIKKIEFINFILKFSILFLILQLILTIFVVPNTQTLGRNYLKNSNIDFFPNLISEKKFISIFKNLTIFIDEYKPGGNLEKVYIKEIIDNNKSKIISAESGKIINLDNKYYLKLFDGGITNIDKNKTYTLNFSETEYDLSKFSSRTITHPKIQEINSVILFQCVKNKIYLNINFDNEVCERPIKQIFEELFKRVVLPFYIVVISILASFLIIIPNKENKLKYYKLMIFIFGFFVIILSQLTYKIIHQSMFLSHFAMGIPILIIIFMYMYLGLKTKFRLNRL